MAADVQIGEQRRTSAGNVYRLERIDGPWRIAAGPAGEQGHPVAADPEGTVPRAREGQPEAG
jgi:hypothetical protein